MSDLEIIWKNVLGEIELEVSKPNFLTWFKSTSLLALENDTATIGVHSAMIMNMLQKRFLPTIKASLDKHTQKDIQIIFVPRTTVGTTSRPQEETKGTLFETPKPQLRNLPRVRSDYTFETLAVSESNRLAFASTQHVAENLGKSYNPLFIYGPVGVGKTHLMQAIANAVYIKDPSLKIIYITSEEFTNEVVDAIFTKDTSKMKKRFRSANLLIIDDVQFFAGKEKVQEELFHTFNTLIDNAAQIVLSSDKPPSEIKKLEARLSSRFSGGLTVDVEPPDFEMRTAIVLKKAEKHGFSLSIDIAKVIAEREQDVRSLEGALLRVITQSQINKETITAISAGDAINTGNKLEKSRIHPDEIIKTICTYFAIKSTQLKGPKRDASLVKARQIAMYLLKKELNLPLVEIGNLLGGRDHTTIIYGVEKMERLIVEKPSFTEEIMGITKQLRG